MGRLCRDVGHTVRLLRRNRGCAAAVLVTIALGVGGAPLDTVAFLTAPLLLMVVAFAACLLPAWRAATMDPVAELSAE